MTADRGGLPLSNPSLRSPFSSMPRRSLASRAPRGPPGCPQIRLGRAAPGPDHSKAATPVGCSCFGNGRRATLAPARPFRGRGAADWAAGAVLPPLSLPETRPAALSSSSGYGGRRRPQGRSAGRDKGGGRPERGGARCAGTSTCNVFSGRAPLRALPLAICGRARLHARTLGGGGRVVCDAGNVVTPPRGFAGWCVFSGW